MIKLILPAVVLAAVAASAVSASAAPLPSGTVQVMLNETVTPANPAGLCISTGALASKAHVGTKLVLRPCNPTYRDQAWSYTSPSTFVFAANPTLEAGWDPFGKMQLVPAGTGNQFTYSAPTQPTGSFTAVNSSSMIEYLEWPGVPTISNSDARVLVTPSYNSFTGTWTIIPR